MSDSPSNKRPKPDTVDNTDEPAAKRQRMEEKKDEEIVTVTGASGYVAGPIIAELRRRGYTVRGTVRSLANEDKVAHLKQLFPEVQLFEADLLQEGSFATSFAGASYVIHAASPFLAKFSDPQTELVDPALNGTKNVMQCAKDANVRRVVVTSSMAAVTAQTAQDDPSSVPEGKIFTEEDWNDSSTLENGAYRLSKFLAEKAAWEFSEANSIELVVLNPSFILGPPLSNRIDSVSVQVIVDMFNGKYADGVPANAFGMNDVRDLANAHVEAMIRPEAAGKRIIVSSDTGVTRLEMADMLRTQERFQKYPLPTKIVSDAFYRTRQSNDRLREVLGITLRDPVVTLSEMADDLIQRGLIVEPPASA